MMLETQRKPIEYRNELNPVWCTGCGDYGVLKSFTRAFARLGLPNERIAIISGIGCSSRLPGYCRTYGFNTIHGRALPIATGLKTTRSDLTVIACGGDGDAFAIGAGHIPNAIRRNPDITYFVMDNSCYGLTKGQASPTTSQDLKERRHLIGVGEAPINPVLFVLSCDAGFVARTHSGDMAHMTEMLMQAIQYPGFSFVHCLSACVTYHGKEIQEKLTETCHLLPENYNPADKAQALHLAQSDSWALGVIYRRGVERDGEELHAQ